MQVILTEDEYLKLKHQHEETRKNYVKRIDVSLALQEMIKEIASQRSGVYDPITFQPSVANWQKVIDKFWDSCKDLST